MLKARDNRKKVPEKEAPAMVGVPRPGRQRGVYGISVAAELDGMGVQKLRSYEARGLLEPERTEGGTRRYSADDLDRLRGIGDLLGAGGGGTRSECALRGGGGVASAGPGGGPPAATAPTTWTGCGGLATCWTPG